MSDTIKLNELIGYDPDQKNFALGTHDLKGRKREGNDLKAAFEYQREVDALLAEIGRGWSAEDHVALAQAIVEPIEQVVPYVEMYSPVFFQPVTYGDTEDNKIPVEDIVTIAWETHQDGSARPVRAGFTWTRPSFVTYDTSMEVPWNLMRKAGWNILARQMRYATYDLARKRDELAVNVWVAALTASHVVTVSGGALTKASIDTVIKSAADIGVPVMRALINPGTLADMVDFTFPAGVNLPDARVEQLLTTLHVANYGGIAWYTNPHFPTNRVRFGGPPAQIGWHQMRGAVRNSSQTEVRNKLDLYLIEDVENAFYVGNSNSLWEVRITA